MANMHWIFSYALVLIFYILDCQLSNVTGHNIANEKLKKHKGTVKTYENEYGDIFDCVNIYKQPAFDHPLLVNHTIQMKSKWFPKNVHCPPKHSSVQNERNVTYHCPKGTIPIIRSYKLDVKTDVAKSNAYDNKLEYAKVGTKREGDPLFGAAAILEVWNPQVSFPHEHSLAQVTLASSYGTIQQRNSINAGWRVPNRSVPDSKLPTRFFIRWTNDGNMRTGCYDLECPGFVQTNSQIEIGGALQTGGFLTILIVKDSVDGNWWVSKDCENIGYWPKNLFTSLSEGGAEQAFFGGEVANNENFGRHTKTQMGNGKFGHRGEGVAAAFSFVQVVDQLRGPLKKLGEHDIHVNKPSSYDLLVDDPHQPTDSFYMYYGGPGRT